MAPADPPFEPVTLAGRFEILPDKPLPPLDTVGGQAYGVRGLRDRKSELFAILCTGNLPPRTEILMPVRAVDHPGFMRVLEAGVVDWPASGRRHYAIVYERPAGRALLSSLDEQREGMPEDAVTRQVVQPLYGALKELGSRGIAHGEVRPTNIFHRDQASGGIALGDCLSCLPSYGQHVLFLSIERGLAQPSGRGPGTPADDLYAFGVTILVMLLGRNPLRQLDADGVLAAKMDRGTYPALAGQLRLSQAMMEILRGLLSDDPKQRWTLGDIDLWLSNRRLSPKQPQVPRKASRPFEFGGAEYWHCRALARALAADVAAAMRSIDGGELDRWLHRGLSDEARAGAVASAVESAQAGGRGLHFEDRMVARVCTALDPPAPLRYRGQFLMLDGFGGALAEASVKGDGVQALAQAITAQLPMFWVNMQAEAKAEFVPLIQSFEMMRGFLEKPAPGFGIERVLYELNPAMPCVSAPVAAFFCLTPYDLLAALDIVGARGDRPRDPLDRHVAAFIAARYRRVEERLFSLTLASIEPMRRVSALLAILADLQRHFGPASLPGLCAWMADLADPAVDHFRSRPTRAKLRADLRKAAKAGELPVLLRMLDDAEATKRDQAGFARAEVSYQAKSRERAELRQEAADGTRIAETLGRQIAAIVSSVLGTLLLIALVAVTLVL